MSDTYFDLPKRLEEAFAEIDNDIIVNFRNTNEKYAGLQKQLSKMKQKNPFIDKILKDNDEVHLTAEEHMALAKYFRLYREVDDMERLQIYFRGHTDAVAYLKKLKAI